MTLPSTLPSQIALSLVSHTNVGKTTLARTLLRRDIGEVRDEAHVTLAAERHTLIESPEGDRLALWDTPGFGDSLRLAQRLRQAGNPIGWFLAEVWDRWRHPAFWSSQHAVRNILDDADAVLYLVNASEGPDDAGYLDAEFEVLGLIGKPVVVLLNQLGPPPAPAEASAEIERWRLRTAGFGSVRAVLALDAFARCWVQEGALLHAVAALLPTSRQAAMARLEAAWEARGVATWQASLEILAGRLSEAALDRQTVTDSGWSDRLHDLGSSLGLRRDGGAPSARQRAMQQLAARLDERLRTSTDALIRLHGLGGQAAERVLARLAEHYAVDAPLSERKAATLGGLATGALAGLKADLLSGGLTLGGGLLAGGLIGALSAAGLARGFNLVRGVSTPTLAWTDDVLDELARSSLLGYLAVAHFGRGRGDWQATEQPAFWAGQVDAVVAGRIDSLHALWQQRGAGPAARAELTRHLVDWLGDASAALLERLYPESPQRSGVMPPGGGGGNS